MPINYLNIEKGYAIFNGNEANVVPHSHHAFEFFLNDTVSFDVVVENECLHNIKNILIAPDVTHEYLGNPKNYTIIFIDPEFININSFFNSSFKNLKNALELDSLIKANNISSDLLKKDLITNLNKVRKPENLLDSRIIKCLTSIEERLNNGPLSLDSFAKDVHLSTSRLYHLFKHETGISIRRYILWSRLKKAIVGLKEGESITNASYMGGFSDVAHFSRTFKKMFGVSPSSIFKD